MEEDIEVIAFACRGTLLDWAGAIEAVVYELARRNGESPLDRGVALRRRVEALADGHGLARGFERLARERGYTSEESGDESLARVVALARPLRGARELVALAARSGRRLVAVSRGESPGALYEFGAPFEAVLVGPRRGCAGRGARARALRERGGVAARRGALAGHERRRARASSPERSSRVRLSWRPDERTRRAADLDAGSRRRLPARADPRRQDRTRRAPARARARGRVRRRAPDGPRGDPDALPRGPARARAQPQRAHPGAHARGDPGPVLGPDPDRVPGRALGARARRVAGTRARGDRRDGGAARRRRLEPGGRRRRRVPPRARAARSARRGWSGSTTRSRARSACASPSCAPAGPRRRRSARSTTRCSRCSSPATSTPPRRA